MLFNRLTYRPLLALFAATALFLSGCGAFIFNPERELTADPAFDAVAPHEDVFFTTADNVRLHGWLFRAARPKGIVVFLHGYEENISTQARNVAWLVAAGYDLFAPDYRGHGRSEGSPSIAGINVDGLAALDEGFRLRPGNGPVFLFGQSMGAAVAVWTAANSPHRGDIAALIIDAPFSSYRLIAKESLAKSATKWPLQYFTFLLNDSYSPIRWIGRVSPVPVLIIHGAEDATNMPYHSQRLFEAAGEPKELWMVEGKGHPRALEGASEQKRLIEYMDGIIREEAGKNR
ncbi:MAG: alpha/beta fold hydrolase [Deltaproteobacteria bacterium]|nr:alpha/beta fold hydrolase [Deltaproteobacteria bacterium]